MKLPTALAIVLALYIPAAAGAQERVVVPACQGSAGYAAAFSSRRTFLWRPDWMSATKARGAQDPAVAVAWKQVFSSADRALAGPTYSVINKTRIPPSGDKHDYLSMGPYWWPDATRPSGEPYVRRDGRVNPERDSNAFDTAALEAMSGAVEALSLAYYFSDDARYARKAAELLRVWFLGPGTRMKPNASFAQGVPGRTTGRAEGVLDTFRLIRVVEGIGLLAPARVLSAAEQTGLERWFGDYVTWMMTSPTGQEERDAENNHALWYDHQLAHYALFARREQIAREVVSSFVPRRLAKQIDPDGKLPRELGRTRPWHYTVFALRASAGLAELGRCFQLDLWHATGNGRSLKVAIDFILPYVGREQEFPYPDLHAGATEESFELFSRAAWAYGGMEYRDAAAKLAQYNRGSKLNLTIAPYAPQ
jgi:hypothetical protein